MNIMILGLSLFVLTFGTTLCLADTSATNTTQEGQTVIILLGPPGSGKGTQAVRLTKDLAIPHISTGDLFRENISKDTELGRRAKTYMNEGKLVPDEVVLDMLFDRISRPDCAKGYLLDGFPRTIPQAEALEKHLKPGTKVVVLNLDVPDEIIVNRVAGRYTCKDCGHIHNLGLTPIDSEKVCQKCAGQLTQRPDDKPEVVKERLNVYHAQTKPLVDFYAKKGVLNTVDGTKTPDQVYSDLKGKLGISQ